MLVQPATALQGPQLSAIRAAEPAAAADAITRLLKYVDGMFNFAEHKKLNTIQASMLANDIAQRYWQLKFDEVVYVFREGANGRYHTFDRIDPGVIHGWFSEYLKERDELVEALAHNQMIAEKKASDLANQNTVEYLNNLPQSDGKPAVDIHRSYLKNRMEASTDEDLHKGVAYYTRNQHLEDAALKVELAQEVLQERATRLQRAQEAARAKARQALQEFAQIEAQDVDYELIINPSEDQNGYWKTKDVAKRPNAA